MWKILIIASALSLIALIISIFGVIYSNVPIMIAAVVIIFFCGLCPMIYVNHKYEDE